MPLPKEQDALFKELIEEAKKNEVDY